MRQVTRTEIQHYREHGVVYLPKLLDADWLADMESAFAEAMFADASNLNHIDIGQAATALAQSGATLLNPSAEKAPGQFWVRTFNWRQFDSIEKLSRTSQMAENVAALMGSTRLNFYGEQLFFKEAGSMHRTAFHQDAPYFHLEGDQCCTIWMPLDAVDADNSVMGYVRGSHRWPLHAANSFASQITLPGSKLPSLPDIEGAEDQYDIVYYPATPGDAIVHHVRTVHGSTGNESTRDRRAFALRYLGDDVRYLEREGAAYDSQQSPALMNGDVMDSEEFPSIWREAT